MITLFGPYGDFEGDLTEIGEILRTQYGYKNCKLVSEREYRDRSLDEDIYSTNKSFYFLGESSVVVFIFFCDTKEKVAHEGSPSAELTHLIKELPNKIKCCFVLRQKGCNMGSIVFGQVKMKQDIMYEWLEFDNNSDIAKIIQAKCRTFLNEKYHEIMIY